MRFVEADERMVESNGNPAAAGASSARRPSSVERMGRAGQPGGQDKTEAEQAMLWREDRHRFRDGADERLRLLNIGQRLAKRMGWETVVKEHLLPALGRC
jgi:hypothetical protein